MSAETPKTDRKPTRQRHPSYDVYRQDDDGMLDLIEADVKAPTRREAIVKATASLPEDRQVGTFATWPARRGPDDHAGSEGRTDGPTDIWT